MGIGSHKYVVAKTEVMFVAGEIYQRPGERKTPRWITTMISAQLRDIGSPHGRPDNAVLFSAAINQRFCKYRGEMDGTSHCRVSKVVASK